MSHCEGCRARNAALKLVTPTKNILCAYLTATALIKTVEDGDGVEMGMLKRRIWRMKMSSKNVECMRMSVVVSLILITWMMSGNR